MKTNFYAIISRAVEEGARLGVNRARKHVEYPDIDTLVENVEREIMNSLCEVFTFDEEQF